MLFLLFQLGSERYALQASHVVEVLPLLSLKPLAQAPPGIAGLLNYRGRLVAALDLSQLTLGQPARECLSTRILVVRLADKAGKEHLLGLIAEQATEILQRHPNDFSHASLALNQPPYLGPVLLEPSGPIQWVREEHLLPESTRELLLAQTAQWNHEAH